MFGKIKQWFNKVKPVTEKALSQDTIDDIISIVSTGVDLVQRIIKVINDFKDLKGGVNNG